MFQVLSRVSVVIMEGRKRDLREASLQYLYCCCIITLLT